MALQLPIHTKNPSLSVLMMVNRLSLLCVQSFGWNRMNEIQFVNAGCVFVIRWRMILSEQLTLLSTLADLICPAMTVQ
jgi:hypothetical protein